MINPRLALAYSSRSCAGRILLAGKVPINPCYRSSGRHGGYPILGVGAGASIDAQAVDEARD